MSVREESEVKASFQLRAVFGISNYVIMANLYLQEIQQSLLSQLENLNNSFAKLKQRFTAVLVCQYFHLNIKVKDIGMTILEYNRLCSLILSSIVPFYVAIVCYMFYVVSIAKVRFFVKIISYVALFFIYMIKTENNKLGKN
ncbi:hypothetical protein TYRP_020402 [Tyrophagus putrescentiae]|nr:hypothetical protein TYRP_020402 [Tyrophagus putrescentiae]